MTAARRVLAIALLAAAGAAQGQARQADLFAQLDVDDDGNLSASELRGGGAPRASWLAHDRDRDGRISRAEFTPLGYAEAPRQAPEESASGGATRLRVRAAPPCACEPDDRQSTVQQVYIVPPDATGRYAQGGYGYGYGRQIYPWPRVEFVPGYGIPPLPGGWPAAVR